MVQPRAWHMGGDQQICISPPRSPAGIGTLRPWHGAAPHKPDVPRCFACTSGRFCAKSSSAKRHCVVRSPQLELLMSRGGRDPLSGCRPSDKARVCVKSPLVCGWSVPAPTPQPVENRAAPFANYLPSRGLSPQIWGCGMGRGKAVLLIGVFPKTL